jgi:small subunit ribosomal protein S6
LETVAKNKLYEGMFLVDSARVGSDWDGIIAAIRTILERAEAEIISIRKWDDRRLAYGVNGKTRGTYILCYFKADGEEIRDIEKAVQLSEQIMRVLILSAEQLTAEDIEKDTPATKVEKEREKRQAAKETAQEAKDEQVSAPEETQEAGQKEAEDSQKPEPSMAADDSMENQPEQNQSEDSESWSAEKEPE